MKTEKVYALCTTALGFCVFHHFADRNLDMRPVYGWFSIVIVGIMAMMALISYLRRQKAPEPIKAAAASKPQPIAPGGSSPVEAKAGTDGNDRTILRQIAVELRDRGSKPLTTGETSELDRKLRPLFECSSDPKVRADAFELWEALHETWIQGLRSQGNTELAEEWESLTNNYKRQLRNITEAEKMMSHPDFIERLMSLKHENEA